MKAQVSCVVRVLGGNNELVRIEDSFNHVKGEKVLTGLMFSTVITSGPSGSHRVKVWAPLGEVVESAYGIEAVNDDMLPAVDSSDSLGLLGIDMSIVPQIDAELTPVMAA